MIKHEPYSWRQDPAVPAFPDDRPVIVFDGHCVLCSRWARFIVRHDTAKQFRLLPAQSPTGRALYVHYGLDPEDYETNILLADGVAWLKSESVIRTALRLGFPWSLVAALLVLPFGWRERLYGLLARNRLRLFGRSDSCMLPVPGQEDRFLT
jgi:predicted DCC family thiol-disulfide oxidoreductase YuxK